MHSIYKLKDMLCKELEEYGERSQLDKNSLETVDTLAHALKNVEKVIECHEEEQYSEAMSRDGMSHRYSMGSIDDGMGHYHFPQYTRYSEEDGGSNYSRRGSYNGSYDTSRRGYSRNGDVADSLRELMSNAPAEMQGDIKRLIQKFDNM